MAAVQQTPPDSGGIPSNEFGWKGWRGKEKKKKVCGGLERILRQIRRRRDSPTPPAVASAVAVSQQRTVKRPLGLVRPLTDGDKWTLVSFRERTRTSVSGCRSLALTLALDSPLHQTHSPHCPAQIKPLDTAAHMKETPCFYLYSTPMHTHTHTYISIYIYKSIRIFIECLFLKRIKQSSHWFSTSVVTRERESLGLNNAHKKRIKKTQSETTKSKNNVLTRTPNCSVNVIY